MKAFRLVILTLAGALFGHAELTTAQKIADFQTMADQFLRRYVSLQWKNQVFGVDGFDTKPFLDRAAKTTNDLDFYDVCIDYIAQFRDGGHVFFEVPSDFVADMGIRVDTFDGKPLIYAINRAVLPTSQYPFGVGDEIVSIDGVAAADLMKSLAKYGINSNPRTEAAYAALFMTVRPQSAIPHAVDVPDSSQVVIKRQNGNSETYTIKWNKSGVPLKQIGPAPAPANQPAAARRRHTNIPSDWFDGTPELPKPQRSMIRPTLATSGIGSRTPIFFAGLPSNFRLRLGSRSTDSFFSGTYQAGSLNIGFIRIPSFEPASVPFALAQFEAEIAFFNANTDGLVIDVMRNPGGLVYYGEELTRRLIGNPFRLVGFELRSTQDWVLTFSSYVAFDQAIGAPTYVTNYQKALLDDVIASYNDGSHTGPEPLDIVALSPPPVVPSLDTTPATDQNGNVISYHKPMMVLTDEFSFSGGEYFPATMQDNGAATIYGMRTGGLGGTNSAFDAGAFSEASIGMLLGLMYRKNPVTAPGYPTSFYVENVGVQPDIVDDYKTLDNLLNGGRTFVNNFTNAMVNIIQGKKP